MNRTSFCAGLLAASTFLFTSPAMAQAMIETDKQVHDFGTMEKHSDPTVEFEIRNSGTSPLIISSAKASSGSIVPTWPREPIMPGQTGYVSVTYDAGRLGAINKSVVVMSNAVNSPTFVLRIKGYIEPAARDEGMPTRP